MAQRNRRGVVLYYMTGLMVLLCGICSLAVDLGRVQLSKTELRRAADSAARAAAAELPDIGSAITFASQYATLNTADGQALVLDSGQDIQFGTWDPKSKTFSRLTGIQMSDANCVRVTLRRTAQRNTAVPLVFAKVLGQSFCDISADSYAMLVPGVDVNQNIPGTANPFLAGMPPGSVASLNNPHNSPDYAGTASNPRQSPLVISMSLKAGELLTFDSIDGTVRHDPNLPFFSPDGELSDIGHNSNGSENGISDLTAPINALVGVFLDDKQPNWSKAPKSLNFTTQASRDFIDLQPQVKQLFFIGDGKNSNGVRQQFIVPQGATRLYLATWDYYEWNNNYGSRNVQVKRPQKIITVK